MKTEDLESVLRNILSALNDIKYEMAELSYHKDLSLFDHTQLDYYTKEIKKDLDKVYGYTYE